eukprot:COSAG05_NODE_1208_length_5523_cov_14.095686_1_plen_63_part_00
MCVYVNVGVCVCVGLCACVGGVCPAHLALSACCRFPRYVLWQPLVKFFMICMNFTVPLYMYW